MIQHTQQVYSKNKLKHWFLKWLLKDVELGYNISNNSLDNSTIQVHLTTYGKITLRDGDITSLKQNQ